MIRRFRSNAEARIWLKLVRDYAPGDTETPEEHAAAAGDIADAILAEYSRRIDGEEPTR